MRDGVPKPPPGGWNLPAVKTTDPAALRAPANNPSMTWIGHATVLVRLAGHTVLFDPIFSEHASPLPFAGPQRVVPLPIDIDDLPKIDVVMISHNHYDHLDEASVRAARRDAAGQPALPGAAGPEALVRRSSASPASTSTTGGRRRSEGPLAITLVPVQHWSRRTLDDTNQTLWGGWVVEGEGLKLVHTGDTGYSQDFRDIGERLGPFDLAFIPIGAYAPRWFMQMMHVNVPEAVQVRADLRAERRRSASTGARSSHFPTSRSTSRRRCSQSSARRTGCPASSSTS